VETYRVTLTMICNGDDISVLQLGAEGFTPESDQELVRKIERQLKNRFPIGSQVGGTC